MPQFILYIQNDEDIIIASEKSKLSFKIYKLDFTDYHVSYSLYLKFFYFEFNFDQIMYLYHLSYHSGNEIRMAKMFKLWLLANHNYQKLIIVKT